MNEKPNRMGCPARSSLMLLTAVVLMAAIAFVPMDQVDATDIWITDIEQIEDSDGVYLIITFNQDIAKGTAYRVSIDGDILTVGVFPAEQSALACSISGELSDEEHVIGVRIGSSTCEYTIKKPAVPQTFDLYLRDAKNPGVIFKLDGVEASGTVTAEEGQVLSVEVRDGYTGTPVVYISGVQVDNPCTLTFGGPVSVSGVEEIEFKQVTISGDIVGGDGVPVSVYSEYMIVTISGICTLHEGARLEINGRLTVPEGAVLTVMSGAVLSAADAEISGTLCIDQEDGGIASGFVALGGVITDVSEEEYEDAGGEVSISGKAVVGGTLMFFGNADISGTVLVAETGRMGPHTDLLATYPVSVAYGGEVCVYGYSRAVYLCEGTLEFDTSVANPINIVDLLAPCAVVDLRNYTSGYIGITDYGASLSKDRTVTEEEANEVVVGAYGTTDGSLATVSGMRIELLNMDIDGVMRGVLNVSGSVSVKAFSDGGTDDPKGTAFIQFDGRTRIEVSDSLVIGAGVTVDSDDNLCIKGTLDASLCGNFTADVLILPETGGLVRLDGAVWVKGQIFASPSAVIDEDTTGRLASTSYHVDGEYLTVYDATGSFAINSVSGVPVENAYTDGRWYDSDGDAVTDMAVIGDLTDVYAVVEYGIYDVIIRADEGINKVYLGGKAMDEITMTSEDGGSSRAFTATGLEAGSYEVTWTLKNGYSGDAVLLIDGTEVPGNVLVLSGNPDSDSHIIFEGTLSVDYPATENITVSIKSASDGNLYVIIASLDGKSISAGRIDVTLNYTAQIGSKKINRHDEILPVEIAGSDNGYCVQKIDMSSSAHLLLGTSVYATYTSDTAVFESDVTAYSPVKSRRGCDGDLWKRY